MAKAAVATELLDKNLDHLGGTNVSTSRQIDRTTTSNERLGESTRSASKDVDRYSGRLGLLADAAITLGPALIPLGATTIPVLTTALAGLGASAAGIGTAVLAFHGLGDAIKAIDTYKLAPTVENLSKLRAEEAKFGPAGTRFATYISSLEPELQRLQQVARAGLFPGLEDGIGTLLTKLPQVRQVLRQVSSGMGELAREGGQALAGGKFSGFFAYLKTDAEPTMASFARSTGHLVETFTNLMVAFAPLNRNLTGGIEGATAALAKWSEGLSGNDSFQSFLTYLETNGPKAIALLDSLVGTFASIVQAAAPIGAELLPLLTDLSDVIGAIARSDLGTPLIAGIVALRLFSRAQQGIGAIADTSFGKVLSGQREATSGFAKASSAAKRFATDLENVARYGNLATESSGRLKGTLSTFGKGSAGIAGLALATSGLADKIGLGHTASLALIGAMAGPEGAVAGGLIGAVLDLKDANTRASASQRDLNALIAQSPTSFTAQAQAIEELRKKNSDFYAQEAKDQKTLGDFSPLNVFKPSQWAAYGRSVEQALGIINSSWDESSSKALAASQKMQVAIATIARGTGDTSVPTPEAFLQGQAGFLDTVKGPGQNVESLNALQAAAAKLEPTLNALGISFDDLGKMTPAQLQATVGAIKAYNTRAESTKSMNQAVAASFQDLDNQMDSTSESASNVADSLDALLNPKLSLSAASDAWAAGLRNLTKDLDKSSRSLVGNTDAADKNRAAIRDRVTSLVAVLDAQAKAGASAGKLTHTLQDGRQALIKQGEAAGFTKSQMVAYVNQLGLTPKLVKTVIQANTAQAQANVKALLNGINSLHDRTVTIRMNTVHTDSSGVSYQHGGATHSADGGTVPKSGLPYADRYLYMLADGEEIISNRRGQADHFRADRASGRIPGYADGGTTGFPKSPDLVNTYPTTDQAALAYEAAAAHEVTHDAIVLAASLKDLKKQVDASKEAFDKEKQAVTDLRSTMADFASQVAGKFTVDLSGSPSSGVDLSGVKGLDPSVAYQIAQTAQGDPIANQIAAEATAGAQAGQMPGIIAALKAAGVTGQALVQILTQESFANLLQLAANPGQAQALAAGITSTAGLAASAGQAASSTVYGASLHDTVREFRQLRAEMRTYRSEEAAAEKVAKAQREQIRKAAAVDGPAQTAADLNNRGAAAKARAHAGG